MDSHDSHLAVTVPAHRIALQVAYVQSGDVPAYSPDELYKLVAPVGSDRNEWGPTAEIIG